MDELEQEPCERVMPHQHCPGFETLAARLRDVEAERDEARQLQRRMAYEHNAWCGFKALLVKEAEARRHSAAGRARAEARLSAVLALCDQWDDLPNHVRRDIGAFDVVCEVRAAARGEGPAAEEDEHGS